MKTVGAILVGGIALVSLVLADGSDARHTWRNNHFVNPTRNIRCLYDPNDGHGTITCAAMNRKAEVSLSSNGTRMRITPPPVLLQPYWRISYPVLRYRQTWKVNNGILSCTSLRRGMQCVAMYRHGNRALNQGFFINRWRTTAFPPGSGP